MAEHKVTPNKTRLPGLDADATPLIGVGIGLAGILFGLRPRLAAWPLALTAAAALLYRDPERATPVEDGAVYAPADGTLIAVEELYEHRFLHTDAVRLAIATAPYDVPVQRSPVAGSVAYVEHVSGEYRPIWDVRASENNERQYIGIKTAWGPVLVALVAGPLSRKMTCRVSEGEVIAAGVRISTLRFGGRVDLLLPCDELDDLPEVGDRLQAGVTCVGRVETL